MDHDFHEKYSFLRVFILFFCCASCIVSRWVARGANATVLRCDMDLMVSVSSLAPLFPEALLLLLSCEKGEKTDEGIWGRLV